MNSTIKLIKQLMDFRPVSSDVEQVNKSVDFLEQYLSQQGVYTKVEKQDDRKILYAASRNTKTPSILFNAHLDVVPADEQTFRFREQNGWIWGRGTGDCLGNCAVVAHALINCRKTADIGAVFSTDEEIGGATTVFMIKKGYRGKIVLVMDTTSPGYNIAVSHKGIVTIQLIASGKACHGSEPWKGQNAIDQLIEGYMKTKKLFPIVKKGDEWHTTCSANIVSGGTVFNRVPDQAELTLDIRFIDNISSARHLAREIKNISKLKVKILALHPSVIAEEHNPMLKELQMFMETYFKRPVKMIKINGATDARHFKRLNIPIAMLGIPYKNPHAVNERANIKGILTYQDMLTELCKKGLTRNFRV